MNIYIVGLNQLFDIEIDKVNKPTLPLASGEYYPATGVALVSGFAAMASFRIGLLSIYSLVHRQRRFSSRNGVGVSVVHLLPLPDHSVGVGGELRCGGGRWRQRQRFSAALVRISSISFSQLRSRAQWRD